MGNTAIKNIWALFLLLLCPSCIVVQQPTEGSKGITREPNYKPVHMNRERDGITYFNLNWVNRIRTDGVAVEILQADTRSELEATEQQIKYLKVMRHNDELYLYYDFPSGFHKKHGPIKIYLKQALSGITTEGNKITVRDLMFTPSLEVYTYGGTVKCDVNTPNFKLKGNRTGKFDGWIEADYMEVVLTDAAYATVGGSVGEAHIFTQRSGQFLGNSLRAETVTAEAEEESRIEIGIDRNLSAKAFDKAQILYRPNTRIKKDFERHGRGIIEEL